MYNWQDAAGRRHAVSRADYPLPPRPGEGVVLLCGSEVWLSKADFPQFAEYVAHKETCWDCDAVWRVRLGMPPNPAFA